MATEEVAKTVVEIPLRREAAKSFDLQKAVCSHGLFMMSPNRWDSLSRTFSRPLRLSNDAVVEVSVSHHQPTHSLHLHCNLTLSPQHRQSLVDQVIRMLRLSCKDEANLREFENLMAKVGDKGEFNYSGRVFRSPTLFEDMVKCILLCNCQWSRTLSMATALCQLHRATSDGDSLDQNIDCFPSPEELAGLDKRFLAKKCNLGYRVSRIIKLARGVVDGSIPLREIEEEACNGTYEEVACRLRQIDGFGPFTCANVLMCLGFYHVIPTDSETLRHLKQFHSRKSTIRTAPRDLEEIYGKYAPFQFLVYWGELWNFYHQRFGSLSEIPSSDYKLITASNMKSKEQVKRKRTKIA